METRQKLLGVCGLYCGACYHYRASFPEGKHLLTEAARQGKTLPGFTCQGCRADHRYLHSGCVHCQIRACADEHQVPHCGLCSEFPCNKITAFQNDGRVHHLDVLTQLEDLKEKGIDRWLAEQEQRWTCSCGTPFSWYEEHCQHCGTVVDSYGPDPRVT